MTAACRKCRRTDQHAPKCPLAAAWFALVSKTVEWHLTAHDGFFDTCEARECYAGHHAVLPGMGQVVKR